MSPKIFLALALLLFPSPSFTPAAPPAPKTVVLAGGGAEGDIGNPRAWSYRLYAALLERGDLGHDGIVNVAVLSASTETDWLPSYLAWIGTTLGCRVDAINVTAANRSEAASPAVREAVRRADALFIKGGDQGVYYDAWNGTPLEEEILALVSRGGAVGGTSAGAMALSEYCLSGSKDLVSADVMADACTPYLDDASEPGTSGVHADFLSIVRGAAIDTHFTSRGRLGRLLGVMAKAADDSGDRGLTGIGIEAQTGIILRGRSAAVLGTGEVVFIRETAASLCIRVPGRPLHYTHLRLDRLIDGQTYDWPEMGPEPPLRTKRRPRTGAKPSGAAFPRLEDVEGSKEFDSRKFEYSTGIYPSDYALIETGRGLGIPGSVGFADAGNSDNRMDKQETIFMALRERPELAGWLVFAGGSLLRFPGGRDLIGIGGSRSAILLDASEAALLDAAPFPSAYAAPGGRLRTASIWGVIVHVLAPTAQSGFVYDLEDRALFELGGGGRK